MDNYIVINGKKAELTEEQLEKLGIEVEKKRNNPFERRCGGGYYKISQTGNINFNLDGGNIYDVELYDNVNYFNDKDFANQVYLHELLNRKLLKYAYDNEAEDSEWKGEREDLHYYIEYNIITKCFYVRNRYGCKSVNVVYFSSEDIAKKAIEDVIKPFIEENINFEL